MSTITRLPASYLDADQYLYDTVCLETFWDDPEAVLDLVYGSARRIYGAAPAHDHDENGGESLYLPLLQHSFGQYVQNTNVAGIPLVWPDDGSSFAAVTRQGVVDRSGAKRLFCAAVTIPGGVSAVRVSISEYHEIASGAVVLAACLRPLSAVNFKLGVTPSEVIGLISYATVGAASYANQSVALSDLSDLGDPTRDREVEFSLWLHCDLASPYDEHRILDVAVVPVTLTSGAREASPSDLVHPQIAVREIKSDSGIINGQLIAKIKELYNGLNRALWGSTPGLDDRLRPDQRRRYREAIEACHQHLGRYLPLPGGGVGSDGAVLKDTQAMGFVGYLGETLPLAAGAAARGDGRPNQGAWLHFADDLSQGWMRFQFRRSIPAGCGELVFRFGAHPGYEYSAPSFDSSQRLLVSIEIVPAGSSSGDIVTRLFSGPYASPLDSGETDYGYVEVEPVDDPAYLSRDALVPAGKKGWNRGVEIAEADRAAQGMNSVIYRVSEPVRAQLTYPPLRPTEAYRPTQDYDIKVRFKMRNSAGLCDDEAGLLWLTCESAEGY